MVLWLDHRLQGKDLRPAQKRDATDILCGLCEALVAGGDESMRALHDRHSRHSLQRKEQDAAADMRAAMEEVLGQGMQDDAGCKRWLKSQKQLRAAADFF